MPTHSVLPEDEVHQQVRQSLESGRLPVLRPDHIHAGYGSGNTCCACGQRIEPAKIEYEVAGPGQLQKLIFHFVCYVIWQRECSLRAGVSTTTGASQAGERRASPSKSPQYSSRCESESPAGLDLESG
jgi:hypothetical protein